MNHIGDKFLGVHSPSISEWHNAKLALMHHNYAGPFAVLAAAPKLFSDSGAKNWILAISPVQDDDFGEITRDFAEWLMVEYHMVRARSLEFGRVYECPGNPFMEAFQGYFITKRLDGIWDGLRHASYVPNGMYRSDIWAHEGSSSITIHAPEDVQRYLNNLAYHCDDMAAKILRRFLDGKTLKFETL